MQTELREQEESAGDLPRCVRPSPLLLICLELCLTDTELLQT